MRSQKLPAVIPVSDLEENATSVLERLRHSGAPAVITQRGREAAVLIDIESFRRSESEREILAALARGEKEIAEGVGSTLTRFSLRRIGSWIATPLEGPLVSVYRAVRHLSRGLAAQIIISPAPGVGAVHRAAHSGLSAMTTGTMEKDLRQVQESGTPFSRNGPSNACGG